MSQNVVTTISASKKTLEDTPSNSNPPTSTTSSTKQSLSLANTTTPNISKTTPSNHKKSDQTLKKKVSSMTRGILEYDFLEYMKKTKSKSSMFELMKM